ncbi:MAG: radical SAM protein [Candidatus Aminicenantes bacterium]|nr:radical SAM protein [Candidatus Aminicenantes bacterium]
MKKKFVSYQPLKKLDIWQKPNKKRTLFYFDLEITSRCNLNCRHCYINSAADDQAALRSELSVQEISAIADEAVSLGALWCLLSGGEPLLRKDFFDIYLALKKKGLLVSVFTNATLITPKHIDFFKKYPPREIEITVYGTSRETYEQISRIPGSYNAFQRGLKLLSAAGIPFELKAMAMRSNLHEMQDIIRFCAENNRDSFRFDPFLHLRYDRNPQRNREIIAERLSPEQIVELERAYPPRFHALQKNVKKLTCSKPADCDSQRLFLCGIGEGSFSLSHDGVMRLCHSLWHPDCVADLRKDTLTHAWDNLYAKVKRMESSRKEFTENCSICSLKNLCMWCPAYTYLETGRLDSWVEGFCRIAHAREESLKINS